MAAFDATNRSAVAFLEASPTTELVFLVKYAEHKITNGTRTTKRLRETIVTTNGTNPVELIPAPAAGYEHELIEASTLNPNAGIVTVNVKYKEGATLYRWVRRFLLPDYQMEYG